MKRPLGQQHPGREAEVGAAHKLGHGDPDHLRQAGPAERRVACERAPAVVDVAPVRLAEAGWRDHHAVLEPEADLIADRVEWRQHIAAERAHTLEEIDDQAEICLLVPGERADTPGVVENVAEEEADQIDGRGVDGHDRIVTESCIDPTSPPHGAREERCARRDVHVGAG